MWYSQPGPRLKHRLRSIQAWPSAQIHRNRSLGTLVSRYAADLVRQRDWPSFVAAFFYPAPVRNQYLALRAYNLELAAVSDETSTPSAGFLRLQWWRQALHLAMAVGELLFSLTSNAQ